MDARFLVAIGTGSGLGCRSSPDFPSNGVNGPPAPASFPTSRSNHCLTGTQPSFRVRLPSGDCAHTGGMENQEYVSTDRLTVAQWTQKLAQATGRPGGGAGSGVMLSMAAALTSMVAGYSESADSGGETERIKLRAEVLRGQSLRLADEDAACSKAFGEAFSTPQGPARSAAIREAALTAAESSAAIGEKAAEVIPDLQWLAEHGNPALVADIVVALGALRAAVSGTRANVRYDLSIMRAHRTAAQGADESADLLEAIERFDSSLRRIDALSAEIDTRIVKRLSGD